MSDKRKRRSQAAETPRTAISSTGVPASDTIDLVELMYRLLGGWKLIVCLALVFAVTAGVYTIFFVTPMYQATSTIYVLSRSDSAINMADLQIGTALTSDYIKVFKMWEVHEEVISNLDLPYTYTEMRSMLSVVNDSDTRMLDITFTSPSAEEAAAVANEYAKVASQYIADTMSTDKPNMMSVALVPTNPVSPNKTKNIMLGFMLGAVLTCGIITIQMLMDDKYKTAEDIRKYTGLATLAVVPVEDGDRIMAKKSTKSSGRKV
ncbi:MAG: Wzz/FepE/Etk N-terminal domain-containing protein [Clostridia bacterium]|nr:Wzz/FepE/Etk N-terminal domain-containing protein [Clostridia bacterium]